MAQSALPKLPNSPPSHPMIVAVTKETFPGERRVALVPAVLPQLTKVGIEVVVQSGAGLAAGLADSAYEEKGARVVESRTEAFTADIVLQVRCLGANPDQGQADLELIRPDQVLIGLCDPLGNPAAIQQLAGQRVSLLALELVPRITRAQSMDVLSSMATIAGYRAVLLGAIHLPKMFPLMMTAAGTISPARVFVIGAGVAGLQAIATSRRLGAIVLAYDVRPAVREQVESLGAKFVEMELETSQSEDKSGYAKTMGEDFYKKQQQLMAEVVAESDVVITTAAIPGKPSPRLITANAVQNMEAGSVIVDLAAERGGNCELTLPDQVVVQHEITILGPTNLPAEIPFHASQMFARNVATFLLHLVQDGEFVLNREDEITRETLVTVGGQITSPRIAELLGVPHAEPAGEAASTSSPVSESKQAE